MTEEPKPQLIREKLDVCELDKARMAILNPALIEQKKNERTIDENAKPVLETDVAGRYRDGLGPVRDATAFVQILPCRNILFTLYHGALPHHPAQPYPWCMRCRC